jgi:hypothetical protein
MAALLLSMTRLMVALSLIRLMLLCPMNQVMADLSKPLLMAALSVIWLLLLAYGPAHGCFVHDLAIAICLWPST